MSTEAVHRGSADGATMRSRVTFGMGYLFLGLLLIVFLGFLVVALARGKPSRGTLHHDKPVSRPEPSAEEANPSASRTASTDQSEHARRHTPPA